MGHAVFWFVNGSLGLLFRFRPDCHLRYAKGNLIEDLKHQTISGLVDGAGRFPAPCQSSQVHGDGLVRPGGWCDLERENFSAGEMIKRSIVNPTPIVLSAEFRSSGPRGPFAGIPFLARAGVMRAGGRGPTATFFLG